MVGQTDRLVEWLMVGWKLNSVERIAINQKSCLYNFISTRLSFLETTKYIIRQKLGSYLNLVIKLYVMNQNSKRPTIRSLFLKCKFIYDEINNN